jgi:hypothetical protein
VVSVMEREGEVRAASRADGQTRAPPCPWAAPFRFRFMKEEEEEEFITSGNWRGKHNSLSRGAGANQP